MRHRERREDGRDRASRDSTGKDAEVSRGGPRVPWGSAKRKASTAAVDYIEGELCEQRLERAGDREGRAQLTGGRKIAEGERLNRRC